MAEFGAKLCSYPGCRQHDFLPYACPACRQVFCSDHMAIGSGHRCDQGEEYLASVSLLEVTTTCCSLLYVPSAHLHVGVRRTCSSSCTLVRSVNELLRDITFSSLHTNKYSGVY